MASLKLSSREKQVLSASVTNGKGLYVIEGSFMNHGLTTRAVTSAFGINRFCTLPHME